MYSPQAGDVIANYELNGHGLGSGTYGEVWKVTHTQLRDERALKIINPSRVMKEQLSFLKVPQLRREWEKRFLGNEARVSGKFQHPNVIGILDAGESDVIRDGDKLKDSAGREVQVSYLLMELMQDSTINEIPTNGMKPKKAVRIAVEACRGLKYLHEEGWVYADVKPQNIMYKDEIKKSLKLSRETVKKEYKIGDTGGAVKRALEPRSIAVYTKATAAPELMKTHKQVEKRIPNSQLEGYDGRADIYALGKTLEWMLTGQPQIDWTKEELEHIDDIDIEQLDEIDDRPAPRKRNPKVGLWLNFVIQKARRYNPKKRWQSISRLLWALMVPFIVKVVIISLLTVGAVSYGYRYLIPLETVTNKADKSFANENYQKAIFWYKWALRRAPNDAGARFRLGQSYVALGLESKENDPEGWGDLVRRGFREMEKAIQKAPDSLRGDYQEQMDNLKQRQDILECLTEKQ